MITITSLAHPHNKQQRGCGCHMLSQHEQQEQVATRMSYSSNPSVSAALLLSLIAEELIRELNSSHLWLPDVDSDFGLDDVAGGVVLTVELQLQCML